ncbi:MAG: acyltransferase [Planctomycetaceae bacterium]|nr:acyltransferase [Planctomycetaceae bacterium]
MSAHGAAIPESREVRPASPRLDGLDWLRAGAAVLVVALHAGIAYLIARMPGLAWATHDPHGSQVVDVVTWWINGFIMPLFFVQSGFLANQLMRRNGSRAFLAHRTRRLLGPFALGCVLILPLDLYAWLLGWVADGRISLRKLQSLKIDGPLGDSLWGVSHLWFLQYLWVFCVAAWIAAFVREKFKLQLAMPLPLIALMVVSSLALWWEPQILLGFRHSWWPLPANLLFYGPWFALGWVAAAGMDSPSGEDGIRLRFLPGRLPFTRWCTWRIGAAVGVYALLLPLIHQHVRATSHEGERLALIGLFMLHAWLMVTGLFGASLKWFNHRPPQSVKYLAEASFWIYLFHHPVVGLTQVSLSQVPLPIEAKFSFTLLTGLVLPLLTYHAFVRNTWVGALLNGRRFGMTTPDSTKTIRDETNSLRRAA